MNKKMGLSVLVFLVLSSAVFGQSVPSDFSAPVPETGALIWMVGAATAGLAGLRMYLGKSR